MMKRRKEEDAGSATTLAALGFVAKLVLWSVVLLLALDNLGVNITGLIAGLGIGGIAVALALQNVLGDLFASLSIVLDKPFVIGDFIIVDEFLGTVEHIGLKTTRVRSLSGEQLVFSNADLLGSRIRNFKRMYERRVAFTVGVTYQTPAEKLPRISAILREVIEAQRDVRFDRAHFKEYGDFALIYEVVYYVTSPDYNKYMDIQQAVNFDIYGRFQQEGLDFAYPTQTLFVQGAISQTETVRTPRADNRGGS
jgi:small-conductance mechanosensitive channel